MMRSERPQDGSAIGVRERLMRLEFLKSSTPAPKINLRHFAWAGACAAIFLSIAAYALYRVGDSAAVSWCYDHTYGWRNNILFTSFKQLGKCWPFLVVLLAWAIFGRGKRALIVTIMALIFVAVSVAAVKGVVQRLRPADALKQESAQEARGFFYSWSFPSGDSASVFATAFVLIPFVTMPWRIGLFVVSAAVAVGRVMSLHHYPSDVAAGAALGILCGLGALALHERLTADAELTEPPGV